MKKILGRFSRLLVWPPRLCDFVSVEFVVRGNVIVYRAQKAIQGEDCRPRQRSWPRFPLARSYPELFRVTGPLLSLVLQTEDVWQRYNQYTEVCALNQGFPFSPLQCRQCRTRMWGWEAQRKCVCCMQRLCCGFGTRRPSNLEAFCKSLEGATQLFIIKLSM